MENFLFVPELTLNLMSLRWLENSEKKVVFHKGKVTVEAADQGVVATGKQVGVLYAMDFHYLATPNAAMVTGKVSMELQLWHQRFGHIGNRNLMKLIDKKMVIKRDGEGKIDRYKARLVAKGFTLVKGFDYSETYSPVAKMTTLRILLALANHLNLHVHEMDVKTAFLNGGLTEEIYMRQPSGFEAENGLVCKLNKAIYGLKQASRSWNLRFHTFITSISFERSGHDQCLYYWSKGEVVIYLVIYVDDILIIGNSITAIKCRKEKLSKEFEMKDLAEVRCFFGIKHQSK